MRLLNHRTNSIRREERNRGELARAMPKVLQRPELLPGYTPHLSYKSPLRGYAYNKSGRRGLRADQVTCGMNRNTLTQKAPHIPFSSPLEHSANPILSGEIRNLALRCSGSHPTYPSPTIPMHAEYALGHNVRLHAHGFWMAAPKPDGAHFRAMADVSASAFTGHPDFMGAKMHQADFQSGPEGPVTPANPAHAPHQKIQGRNPDSPGLAADIGAFANHPFSESQIIAPQSARVGERAWQIQFQASESAQNAPAGGYLNPNTARVADPADSMQIRPSTAIHMTGVRTPYPFISSIRGTVQGMAQGAANLAGLLAGFVPVIVPVFGQTRAYLQGAHADSTNSVGACPEATPNYAQNHTANAAKPADYNSTRVRKAAQLIVARAENPPPE